MWWALMRDVRLAFRRSRTQPGYAVPALLILGLGLGTSVAMLSFVHGLLLRPIALRHLPRLVTLWSVPVDHVEERSIPPTGAVSCILMNRSIRLLALFGGTMLWPWPMPQSAEPRGAVVLVPGSASRITLDVPLSAAPASEPQLQLVEDGGMRQILTPLFSAPAEDGGVATDRRRLVVRLPAQKGETRRLRVGQPAASTVPTTLFRFEPVDDRTLALWEGDRPVLVYNHGVLSKPGVPADRNRSTYIHPLYGLDGEVLTDDFPVDHYHHRGLFWAWPHVRTGGREYDLWTIKGVHQRFERWLAQETRDRAALFAVENGWYAGDQKILQERAWILVHQADDEARCIDLEFFWIPGPEAVTLAGAEGKSYGGLTIRYAPRTDPVITTPLGTGSIDLEMTPLAWADYSGRWTGVTQPSGAALFIHPGHPDYPPTWLTRHYGALCIGWPGVEARTFPAGKPIHCRYRVWVHRGMATKDAIAAAYAAYEAESKARWE